MIRKIRKLCFVFLVLFFVVFMTSAQSLSGAQTADEVADVSTGTDAEIYSIRGFGISVSISQSDYWTDFMPPGWRPPVISMCIRVFNRSLIPVRLQFTTSQRYDFSIYNSRGYEVWRWSDDKAFLQVMGEIVLNPGESIVYTTSIKFADKTGQPMPVDLYTLKGELTTVDFTRHLPRIMEGTVSFEHTYVY